MTAPTVSANAAAACTLASCDASASEALTLTTVVNARMPQQQAERRAWASGGGSSAGSNHADAASAAQGCTGQDGAA
jgi:hypothetical protein